MNDNKQHAHNANVLYYEPNYTPNVYAKTNEQELGMVPLSPDLSDYCIFVNLEVQIPERPICGQVTNSNNTLILNYSSYKNAKSHVSFHQGTTLHSDNGNYLTSLPSELGTFTDIKAENETSAEMFGINSININYDNYLVPIITIQFTDIKGASLFAPEDYRHNVKSNGINDSINPDISGSFFKSFFTFPYPRFILTIKGFYGEPITYELTCQDFRASFDSATGNFGATAKFVGQMFSVLNDITIGALFAAPTTKFGQKYWEQHSNEFTFSDTNVPMPRLLDVIEKIHGIKADTLKTPISNELKEQQTSKQKLHNINDALLAYEIALKNAFKPEGYEYSDNDYIFYTHFTNNKEKPIILGDTSTINSSEMQLAYQELKQRIIAYNNQEIIDININLRLIDNPLTQGNFNNNDYQYCWSVNLGLIYDALSKEEQRIELGLKDLNKVINTSYSQKFYELLGWTPSVKNVVELLLAHLDTFINMVYNYASQVATSQDKDAVYRKEGKSNNASYAFPLVTKIMSDMENNKLRKEEKSWIGEYNMSSPEAVLVSSLLSAMTDINTNITEIKRQENIQSEIFASNILYPIMPFDFVNNSDPFSSIDFKDLSDILGKLLIRCVSVLSKTYRADDARAFGEIDAYNFYHYLERNNIKSTQLAKIFGKNNALTPKDILDFLSGSIKGHDGDNFAWQRDDKAQSLITINEHWIEPNSVGVSYFKASNGGVIIPINRPNWDVLDKFKTTPNLIQQQSDKFVYSYDISTPISENENDFYIDVANYKKYDECFANIQAKKLSNTITKWYENNLYFDIDKYRYYYLNNTYSKFTSASLMSDAQTTNINFFPTKEQIYTNDYDFVVTNHKSFEWAFGTKDNANDDIQTKAIWFLMGYNLFDTNKLSLNLYGYYPYYYILSIGGLLYTYKNNNAKFHSIVNKLHESYLHMAQYLETFNDSQSNTLIKIFMDWVDTNFKQIKVTYDILFTPNDNISEVYSEYTYNASTNSYKLTLNKNNEKLQTITSEYFQPVFGMYYNFKKSNVSVNYECKYVDVYFESFVKKMKSLYQNINVVDTILEQDTNQDAHAESLQIALYNYLKIIWDKWLSGAPKINNKTPWDFANFRKNWHYLDSYYNNLSSEATINIQSFVERIEESFDKVNYNFLNFLSQVLAEDKYLLVNVQNFANLTTDDMMAKMFTPIPFNEIKTKSFNHVSDIIVMYTGEASSQLDLGGDDTGDSYMIGGDDKQLPIAITSKTPNIGHKIPAFGVTYGGQYQSYFTDISISQEKPQTTEVALKTQFALCNASTNRENGKDVKVIGQDLFTIYSNTSYTCTVKMMGCAWVQPLMYFQLNNVPMFRGSYLIHHVSHNISAGQMETTFTGTRMSNIMTPLVRNNILLSANNSTGGTLQILKADSYVKPDITNDCPYEYYSPISTYDEDTMLFNELNMFVLTYAKNRNDVWAKNWDDKSLFPSESWQNTHTIAELLGVIIKSESENQDELGKQLVATVLYNRWRTNDKNLLKVLYNSAQFSLNKWETWNSEADSQYTTMARHIFSETPKFIANKTTFVKEQVPIWNYGKQEKDNYSQSVTLSVDDLMQIDAYATTKGYNTNYKNPRRKYNTDGEKLEPIPTDTTTTLWHSGKYICQHDSANALGHVFVSTNSKYNLHYPLLTTKNNTNVSNRQLIQNIFNSIKLSLGEDSNFLNGIIINKKDNYMEILSNKRPSVLYNVFDIAVNTYKSHLSKIIWVVNSTDDTINAPKSIIIAPSNNAINEQKVVNMSFLQQNELHPITLTFNDKTSLNDNFKRTLKKYYHDKLHLFHECTNFTEDIKYLTDQEISTEFNKYFDITIESCYQILSNDFNWNGTNEPQNNIEPSRCMDAFDATTSINYLKKHLSSSGGSCASAIRKSLMQNLKLTNWPLSACAYSKYLPFWGFNLIGEGVGPYPIIGYTPQKGDIAVIASNPSSLHGHIQMYDGIGNWLSDISCHSVWVYPIQGVPYKIFRHNTL